MKSTHRAIKVINGYFGSTNKKKMISTSQKQFSILKNHSSAHKSRSSSIKKSTPFKLKKNHKNSYFTPKFKIRSDYQKIRSLASHNKEILDEDSKKLCYFADFSNFKLTKKRPITKKIDFRVYDSNNEQQKLREIDLRVPPILAVTRGNKRKKTR